MDRLFCPDRSQRGAARDGAPVVYQRRTVLRKALNSPVPYSW